jgi:hypothetical protein
LDDVDREDGSYGLPKILEGRECLKTSGSTSAWDSCSIVEEGEGGGRFLTVVADFSARRLTACLDSWKKKAPSFPANLPARKLIALSIICCGLDEADLTNRRTGLVNLDLVFPGAVSTLDTIMLNVDL